MSDFSEHLVYDIHGKQRIEEISQDTIRKDPQLTERTVDINKKLEQINEKGSEIAELQKRTEENFKISEHQKYRQTQELELIQKAKNKISLENKLLIEHIAALADKRDEFEKIQADLDLEKKKIDEEKQNLLIDREKVKRLKKKMIEEREILRGEIQEAREARKLYEIKLHEINEASAIQSIVESNGTQGVLDILKKQVEAYNLELYLKEASLVMREQNLAKNLQKFENDLNAKRLIEASLKNTKEELLKINWEIVPEMEKLYENLTKIIKNTSRELEEAKKYVKVLKNDVDIISELKEKTVNHQSNIDKQIEYICLKEEELTKLANLIEKGMINQTYICKSCEDNSLVNRTLQDLLQKRADIEADAEENKKAAEFLKDFISDVNIIRRELIEEKAKIIDERLATEQLYQSTIQKQLELTALQKSLDARSISLKFLERKLINSKVKLNEVPQGSVDSVSLL